MKNLFIPLTLSLLSFSISTTAQTKIGFKTSISKIMAAQSQNYVLTNSETISHDVNFKKFTPAKSVGLYCLSQFDFLFLQTEILLSKYSAEYQIVSYIDDVIANPVVEESKNIDLHVIAGINIKNWQIGVGPVFHKTLNLNSDFDNYAFYSRANNNVNMGFQGMIGYNWGPIHADIKYESIFNKLGDHMNFADIDSKFKSTVSAISFGLGIGF